MACVNFVNLCYIAGTSIAVDWSYTEDDGTTPIDLTGVDADFQYLNAASDLTSVVNLTKSGTNGIVDGALGLGQHTLTIAQGQALLPLGTAAATVDFISHLQFTYPDTSKEVVAGVTSTYEQNLIR